MGIITRFMAAWAALTGNVPEIKIGLQADLTTELERARMDVRERDEEIEKLRKEYTLRERQADTKVASAADDVMLGLMRRLGPLLSQLATMKGMAGEGRDVKTADLLTLFGKIEKAFEYAGLYPIGSVGEEIAFDPRLHQRMSGGDVKNGSPVRVRFVGYRYGDTIVTKSMVSRIE